MKENKSYHFSHRLTEKSKKLLETNSAKAKMSKGSYVEKLINDRQIIIINGFEKFLSDLKQSGKNLHQILVRLNAGQIFSPDVKFVSNLYQEILSELIKITEGEIDYSTYKNETAESR